ISKKHGDFDNDRLTMSGVMRRILRIGDDTPITEFPETVSRTVLDVVASPAHLTPPLLAAAADLSPVVAAAPTAPAVITGPGRRRAICVGIDEYDSPNRLAGCVNDANDWATALQTKGFEVSVIKNKDATWQALNSALSGLVSQARAGDVV